MQLNVTDTSLCLGSEREQTVKKSLGTDSAQWSKRIDLVQSVPLRQLLL